MDLGGSPLPDTVSPENFPAKLWRLVNNPANRAICWDSHGEVITINQNLFEREILYANTFHTTNFSSFVRQLNLYGFRKVRPVNEDHHHPAGDSGTWHHYYNPNFRRNDPGLVASLRRLTVPNKAKMQAGLDMNCRPSGYQWLSGGGRGRDDNVKRGSPSLFSPTHLESTHPYCLNKARAMAVHSGTPVPPAYLIRGHGAAHSPTVFTAGKWIPLAFNHNYAGVASSSKTVQQSTLAYAQYPHSLHPQGYRFEAGSFSPHSCGSASVPVNTSAFRNHNRVPQSKKCHSDINLDTFFQIADEMMPFLPSNGLVRVVSPEKPSPLSCESMLFDSPGSTMQADPLCAGPILKSVSGNANLVTFNQQEESVLSVSKQMADDDAILEHPEIIDVEDCDTLRVSGVADDGSCTSNL